MIPPPPISTLFPYTTLFRSHHKEKNLCFNCGYPGHSSRDCSYPFNPNRIPPKDDQAKSQQTDRKSTRLNSSHLGMSYAVFCLKKKKIATSLSLALLGPSTQP